MKDSKLFQAIKSLSRRDLGRFAKFVESGYHNEHPGVRNFCSLIVEKWDEIDALIEDKHFIYQSVFGNESAYDDLKLRHLFSDVLRLLEEFFAFSSFAENDLTFQYHILKTYRQRSLDKHYTGTLRRIQKLRDRIKKRSIQDYYYRFRLESDLNEFMADHYSRKGKNNVAQASQELDVYFILNKLRYGCMLITYRNVYDKGYDLFLLDEIVNYVKENDFSSYPVVSLYYHVLMMLNNPEQPEFFYTLRNLMHDREAEISNDSLREGYNFAMNYCIGRINRGHQDFYNELFIIHDRMLQQELIFRNGEIAPQKFKNIVAVACHLKEFDWVKNFLSDYTERIPMEHRENAYTFNTAVLYYNLNDYSKSIRYLNMVQYDDPFYALDSKSLMLKMYFELDEVEAFLSLCESFRIYLKRNKLVSTRHIKNYNNLIKYSSRLIKVKAEQNERLTKIENEILDTPEINNKKWLLEQVQRKKSLV